MGSQVQPFVRIAAVPAQHPYPRAIADPTRVVLLTDPTPPGAPVGQWWPPQILDSSWIRRHHDDFDVLHLHFGAESYTPEHVLDAIGEARRAGKPVVYTVHDLENPQLSDQSAHTRMLDAIIPAVDVLVTLTASARDEIAARWGRTATVIAHPTLLDGAHSRDATVPVGHPDTVRRIGVHLRDLRPNIDAIGVVTTLVRTVAELRAAGGRVIGSVRLNERVRDEATAETLVRVVAEADGVEIVRAPRLTDEGLAEALADLDACVLPYAHGTHSGWLELCYDLAVPVIGPRRGHFRDQHPDDYTPYDIGDPTSLASAIERATLPAWSTPGSVSRSAEVAHRESERAVQREEIRAAHAELYRTLTTRRFAA
ncbi:glycosyltransferase [Microbacterium sp. P06]|uniref:glycosyltransferase n=1 Tax=Microbacterium sp. P06 TaxID=3366949 RepID=UPI003745705C